MFKTEAVLELVCGGAIALEVPATFGANPVGHKERQGDEKTPEGEYRVTAKTKSERFHRFLALSYPNEADLTRARAAGIADPGDAIGIHGSKPRIAAIARAWLRLGRITGLAARWGPTDGCIAVTNEDAESLYALVPVGTKVTIAATRASRLR